MVAELARTEQRLEELMVTMPVFQTPELQSFVCCSLLRWTDLPSLRVLFLFFALSRQSSPPFYI